MMKDILDIMDVWTRKRELEDGQLEYFTEKKPLEIVCKKLRYIDAVCQARINDIVS